MMESEYHYSDGPDNARGEAVTVQVCLLWDLQGPLQACEPVIDTISWSGIRVIAHPADGETKCQ